MIENVRGILAPAFADYREHIDERLKKLGYHTQWKLFNAADFGVPQLRPRVVIVALKKEFASEFIWPEGKKKPQTVGRTLHDLMAQRGWRGAAEWRKKANAIAPTIVGGSKKHGGPDLGPTRARKAWAELGVDRTRHRQRCTRSRFHRHAAVNDAHGRPYPRLPGRLGFLGQKDSSLPAGWKRFSATRCACRSRANRASHRRKTTYPPQGPRSCMAG